MIKTQEYKLLDEGFIRVVDTMGDDSAVVQMARVSYGEGTKTVSSDRGLIRYLMRHKHTSPFEGCEIKLHVKMPIFVARQWVRHRMANVNEYSGRYSIMAEEFYVPDVEHIQPQSKTNKQGRGGEFSKEDRLYFQDNIDMSSKTAFALYDKLINMDLSRELARTILPLNIYTEMYWKIDLHNLLHFIKLRNDPHAQYEIRVYAQALEDIIKQWVPLVYEAFIDYQKEAVTFSRMEMEILRIILNVNELDDTENLIDFYAELENSKNKTNGAFSFLSKREITEFKEKLGIE